MSDYHLHLHPHGRDYAWPPFAEYPDGLIESYVEAGAARGVTDLGFTEHLYRTTEGAAVLGRFWETEERTDLRLHTEALMAEDAGLSLPGYVDAVTRGEGPRAAGQARPGGRLRPRNHRRGAGTR